MAYYHVNVFSQSSYNFQNAAKWIDVQLQWVAKCKQWPSAKMIKCVFKIAKWIFCQMKWVAKWKTLPSVMMILIIFKLAIYCIRQIIHLAILKAHLIIFALGHFLHLATHCSIWPLIHLAIFQKNLVIIAPGNLAEYSFGQSLHLAINSFGQFPQKFETNFTGTEKI